MKKTITPLQLFILNIIFCFLSFTQWEIHFYERSRTTLILAVISTVVYALNVVIIEKTKNNFRVFGRIILFISFFVILLNSVAFISRKSDCDFPEFTNINDLLEGKTGVLLDTIRKGDVTVYIVGKHDKKALNKYQGIHFTVDTKRDTLLNNIIPEWFYLYADLINPLKCSFSEISLPENDWQRNYYYSRRYADYLSWQYPNMVIGLFLINTIKNEKSDEYFLWHTGGDILFISDKERIATPKPLLKQLIHKPGKIFKRFYTYRNIIVYTFTSPFTRDLSKYRNIFKKHTITKADLDSLGLNEKQRKSLEAYMTGSQ